MRLENKVAIITGASSGIGEGIAKKFLAEGAKVVGCGIEEKLNFEHENAIYVKANLTNPEDAAKVVEAAVEKFGKVDKVVNCAGITLIGTLETSTVEEFKRQLDINVTGVFNMCKAAIGELKKQEGAAIVNIGSDLGVETSTVEEFKRQLDINVTGVFNMCKAAIGELKKQEGAAIVNIGSDLGVRPIPERIGYCPSKAAVIMLTKCIAAEFAPTVRANCLLPGLVETPMIKDRFEKAEDPDALRREFASIYPLNRMGTIDDMANTAVFLASNESSFITGETIGVCGGSLI